VSIAALSVADLALDLNTAWEMFHPVEYGYMQTKWTFSYKYADIFFGGPRMNTDKQMRPSEVV
jgi:hypothetical protein